MQEKYNESKDFKKKKKKHAKPQHQIQYSPPLYHLLSSPKSHFNIHYKNIASNLSIIESRLLHNFVAL